MFLSIDFLGPKENILSFAQIVKELLDPLISVPCHLFCSKMGEDLGRNFFFTGKTTTFSKICVFNNLLGPRVFILIFPQLMSDYLVDTSKSSLRFVILDKTRQNRPKFSLHWKDCFFFQKFVFSSTSQVPNEWSQNSDSNCQTSFWTLIIWFPRFVTLDNSRKRSQKVLSPWKQLFFEVFLSIAFLGPKKFILSFAQKLSNDSWIHY